MPAKLIITEQCRGLYRVPGTDTVRPCEHPVSHLADCGPDTIAKPYPLPDPPPMPGLGVTPFTPRMIAYIRYHNTKRQGWGIHTTPAATLLAFAALYDEKGAAVEDREVSKALGNAASTVRRHLREHHAIVRHLGRGFFAPQPLTVQIKETP